MISLSTDGLPRRERAEFWADLVSRHVTPIRIEPALEAHALRGEIQARALAQLGIARVSGQGVRALHTGAHVARAKGHVYAVCVHLDGETRINRKSETIGLRRGDIFITDSRHEFGLDLDRPWRHLLLTLPSEYLDGRVERPEALAGAVLPDSPLARLWAAHLAAGFALAGELSPAAATLFVRHSIELLAQLLEECRCVDGTTSYASRAAIFTSGCHLITLRFADPQLTPATIAQAIGVSTRTLARVFAENNTTFMRRLFDERVRQAARLLASPHCVQRSITEIALACGFNDPTHFGRVFAARLQMTPRQWRGRQESFDPTAI
jgi:AraC family transcriptional regulator, positive regulator of tynA and feaB